MQAWAIAEMSKEDLLRASNNVALRRAIVRTAESEGFFSIWMTVFRDDTDMCNRLIDTFPGVRGSGCFDPVAATTVSPAPNPDGLSGGAKI